MPIPHMLLRGRASPSAESKLSTPGPHRGATAVTAAGTGQLRPGIPTVARRAAHIAPLGQRLPNPPNGEYIPTAAPVIPVRSPEETVTPLTITNNGGACTWRVLPDGTLVGL